MKVAHLISGGDVGGAKTVIETLLKELNKTGVDATLLCVMEGALTEECRRLGIKVKVIPQKRRYDLTIIKKMAGWINRCDFDIVHCHGARANFIAFFLRFFVKVPMLTTLHSDYLLDFKGSGYRRWLYTPLNVFSLKRFRHFITISGEFKKMMVARGFDGSRIDVIYNGMDFDTSPNVIGRRELLEKHGISCPENAVIIGCAARLHPVKGVDILLKAAKLLFESDLNGKDALVLIAGDGGERKRLSDYIEENRLSERVKLLGFVDDMPSFYEAIDINVVPSLSEGFSLVLIEGAKWRLNTVASETGGIPEVITDGVTGTLFPPGDYERLSRILAAEVKNPDKTRGERLYEDARRRFSDKTMAERHIEVYEKLKGERK